MMFLHGINDNLLISHPSYLGVCQDEAKNESSTKRYLLSGGLEPNFFYKTVVHVTREIINI